jgi:hypothetical protein
MMSRKSTTVITYHYNEFFILFAVWRITTNIKRWKKHGNTADKDKRLRIVQNYESTWFKPTGKEVLRLV